jgi:hypothetical protein
MNKIAAVPYNQMEFRWVSSYYDSNLNGTCIYNGELCEFKTDVGEYIEEIDKWEEDICVIYKLTWKEKLKWIFRQKKFEWCVGYHYTYFKNGNGKRGNGNHFYIRKPKWIFDILFKLYFKQSLKLLKKK